MNRSRQKVIARETAHEAFNLRLRHGIDLSWPINVIDFAEKLGLEIRFAEIAGLEGFYTNSHGPIIIINSDRPLGRQTFTCAHELGHHIFNHGMMMDSNISPNYKNLASNEEEYIANSFAGHLLMPKLAIGNAFFARRWDISISSPEQVFTISMWLGVSYTALISQMYYTIKMINKLKADSLWKISPKAIKSELIGKKATGDLVVVDRHWLNRAIDIRVGDYILLDFDIEVEGTCINPESCYKGKYVFRATAQGVCRIYNAKLNWYTFVRVSREKYIGRAIYRHLEG